MKRLISFFMMSTLVLATGCMVPSARKDNQQDLSAVLAQAKAQTQTAQTQPAETADKSVHLDAPSVLEDVAQTPAAQTVATATVPAEVQTPAKAEAQPAKKLPADVKDVKVRVLIGENLTTAEIGLSGDVRVYPEGLKNKYQVPYTKTLKLALNGPKKVSVNGIKVAGPVIIVPQKKSKLIWNKNEYTSPIYIVAGEKTFSLVEHTPLENYLYGVLPYEMNYTWPIEALKAQAVAARTYTLNSIKSTANRSFDLYDDVRSQVYRGSGKVYDSIKEAVDATRGKVLRYDGDIFFTYYHANCGGGTDNVNIWNAMTPSIKPLQGASCKYDSHSTSYTWKMNVPNEKITKYANSIGLKGTIKDVVIAKKTSSGRASYLTIKTTQGSKQISCARFRLGTGIRSCKLTKLSVGRKETAFEGHGYGHGIGMCQDGAKGMANEKFTYEQILKHYYPGSKLGAY